MTQNIPDEILRLCERVTAKRPRTVIDHIVKNGFITTEDLKNLYGYDHPPRAIRDVREQGIPLITYRVTSSTTGRKIAAYRFGDPRDIRHGRIGGRIAFSKAFKDLLISSLGARCTLTGEVLAPRYLQIDHRIPYEVAGNSIDLSNPEEFMLLDASSQRAKSWSCEHCLNLIKVRDISICRQCFWAFPETYTHVAMIEERRAVIVWSGEELKQHEIINKQAAKENMQLSEFIKLLIKKAFSNE